jgi:hypothetical protein
VIESVHTDLYRSTERVCVIRINRIDDNDDDE